MSSTAIDDIFCIEEAIIIKKFFNSRSGLAFKAAFPFTLPIFAGFWFLGLTYGIYMNVAGFNWLYPALMSLTIFAGSVEFIAVNLLLGSFNPFQAFVLVFMVNARHLFYGISMIDKYRGFGGFLKSYLVFGLCDESFSINFTAKIPQNVDRGLFYFWVTALNQFYWVSGATLGGIFGSLITFDTHGLEFVLTAMFVVIFLEQFLKESNHLNAIIGFVASTGCLMLFGAENFILPSMALILILLTAFRRRFE